MRAHESPVAGKAELPSAETQRAIDSWRAKFPEGIAAQDQNNGYLTEDLMDAVSDYLELPPVWVYEVATFYSMLEIRPVGRNTISICTNISCMLCGADDVVEYIENKLGARLGETTADGRIFLKREEECVAGCVRAPMMIVNGHYHENLTEERIDEILDGLE